MDFLGRLFPLLDIALVYCLPKVISRLSANPKDRHKWICTLQYYLIPSPKWKISIYILISTLEPTLQKS